MMVAYLFFTRNRRKCLIVSNGSFTLTDNSEKVTMDISILSVIIRLVPQIYCTFPGSTSVSVNEPQVPISL